MSWRAPASLLGLLLLAACPYGFVLGEPEDAGPPQDSGPRQDSGMPDAGANPACVTSGSCRQYQDCCSQNCLAGRCATTPRDELCKFGTPCIKYSDCCSFECRAGECVDSTANL